MGYKISHSSFCEDYMPKQYHCGYLGLLLKLSSPVSFIVLFNVAPRRDTITRVAPILFLTGHVLQTTLCSEEVPGFVPEFSDSLPGCLVITQLSPRRRRTYCVTLGMPLSLSEPSFLLSAL